LIRTSDSGHSLGFLRKKFLLFIISWPGLLAVTKLEIAEPPHAIQRTRASGKQKIRWALAAMRATVRVRQQLLIGLLRCG
jgi:hypothetical protein